MMGHLVMHPLLSGNGCTTVHPSGAWGSGHVMARHVWRQVSWPQRSWQHLEPGAHASSLEQVETEAQLTSESGQILLSANTGATHCSPPSPSLQHLSSSEQSLSTAQVDTDMPALGFGCAAGQVPGLGHTTTGQPKHSPSAGSEACIKQPSGTKGGAHCGF